MNNLIAIEVKFGGIKGKRLADIDKSIELTQGKYYYKYGFSIVIDKTRDKISLQKLSNSSKVES